MRRKLPRGLLILEFVMHLIPGAVLIVIFALIKRFWGP
jgi:hypothetical protein